MSVNIILDPIDIEEMDLHDEEDVGINIYGFQEKVKTSSLGFVTIASENGEIKITVSIPKNVIVEDDDGKILFNGKEA
jgi:hypothetical protein